MSRLRSRVVRSLVGATAVGALLASATGVAASPATWETFPLTCGEVTFVVTASPGFWSIGKVLDASPGTHVVSYGYSITVTDLETDEVLFANSYTKPGARGQESLSCFDYSESVDPDTGHLDAVLFETVLFMPRAD